MLNKLKRRFVIIGTSAVFVFLFIIVAIINIINYNEIIKSIDNVIEVVSKPNVPFFNDDKNLDNPFEEFREFLPKNMSPEVPFETRFFSIIVDNSGNIIEKDKSRIITINDEDLKYYIEASIKSNKDRGFVDNFRFKKINDIYNTRYVFVDSGRKLDSFYTTLKISCLIAVLGCAAICLVFIAVSEKVVSPIVDSYDKQKSFITNAGHEMKTPLTIILANTDLIESEYGKNEVFEDIKKQTNRLKELTNNLIYLSKMQEEDYKFIQIEFPFSDLVEETIESFRSGFLNKNVKLNVNVEPMITLFGDQTSIGQVLNILIENAIKYVPNDKEININLYQKNKKIIFNIENDVDGEIDEKELKYIFERFYRMDKSRNSSTGGHGLGLSIAKTIIEANKGKILPKKLNNNKFSIEVIFKA